MIRLTCSILTLKLQTPKASEFLNSIDGVLSLRYVDVDGLRDKAILSILFSEVCVVEVEVAKARKISDVV